MTDRSGEETEDGLVAISSAVLSTDAPLRFVDGASTLAVSSGVATVSSSACCPPRTNMAVDSDKNDDEVGTRRVIVVGDDLMGNEPSTCVLR